MRILAATDFSTRSNRALRQAGLLAQPSDGELHIVHVVDDDQPEDMVRLETREAKRLLGEQVSSMPELLGAQAVPRVVTGDAFDGILRTAAEIRPDLIVMGSHRKQLLLDIFTGTTIERVIRKGSFPVLMVNFEAQRVYENVVAPIDLSEASARALGIAHSLRLLRDKKITFLHAFLPLGKGKMYVAGLEKASIEDYVASEQRQATEALASFIAANDLKSFQRALRVDEGSPMEVISRTVSELRPDLLVLGTHGRSGVVKALIGSVTEEALRSLEVDILAVPTVK